MDKSGMRILCLGEALIDFKPTGDLGFQGYVGGSPLNVAVACRRLGMPTGFATSLSTDAFGRRIRRHLEESGVDTDLVLENTAPTTLAFVSVMDGREAFAFIAEGAADTCYDPIPRPSPGPETRFLQFGSTSLLLEPAASAILDTVEQGRAKRVTVLDPNVRPAILGDPDAYRRKIEGWLSHADLVKASTDDLTWLAGGREPGEALARSWLAAGVRAVIVTRGADGATVLLAGPRAAARGADGDAAAAGSAAAGRGVEALDVPALGVEALDVPAPTVEVADTVGAGDTFTAGLMVALLERAGAALDAGGEALVGLPEATWRSATRFATVAAALSCTGHGASPPLRAAVDAVLAAESRA